VVAPVRRVVFGRAKLQSKPRQREIPSVLANRYRDLVPINEGGSASVYRATDGLLKMTVAIKTIAEHFAKKTEAMAILFNEARLAMQLSHRNIVRLHTVQESDGIYFLVMEYISGSTLRTILDRSGPLSPETVLQIVGVCEEALGYAHRRQVYHRDLKPENLMLTDDGILKVIDFGVACLALRDVRNREDMQGTPYYISPEEILGKPIDQRADVYSFGITIHELLTGSLPYDGGGTDDPLAYLPVAHEELPEPMRGFLQTSFARECDERWQEINEFAEKFREAYAMSYRSAEACGVIP
jgi:serine/threonine protein kinase